MEVQRIVLIGSDSHLLNDLFRRFITREPGLLLVDEVTNPEKLFASIADEHPDWVIYLEPAKAVSSDWENAIHSLTATCVLTIEIGKNDISFLPTRGRMGVLKKELSLRELVSVLTGNFEPENSSTTN